MKRLALALALTAFAPGAYATESFKVCWSVYVGWMPWAYGAEQGIIDKWADKYDIDIELVKVDDYIESIDMYTAGAFDACTMTNMDALTIPAASGVDSTALIVGDFSNGNDGIALRGADSLRAVEGRMVNLVELSVSHYLLARGLDSVGLSESDVSVLDTPDAEIVEAYTMGGSDAVATWNPLLSEIADLPDTSVTFDSSQIPGEILDLLVVNTDTLAANPDLGKALTGAWYEIMGAMQGKGADEVNTWLGEASGTDLAGYEAQLASTRMFFEPDQALELISSDSMVDAMRNVAEFSFEHGLLGDGAADAGFIGIETPAGLFGSADNVQLRFDPTFMQMVADGEL